MSQYRIRFASLEDAPALLGIYTPYVTGTTITFEYEVPSVTEFEGRIASISKSYPYLVCESSGIPVGYAYASLYRTRAAYQWDVETSIYLHPDAQGKGVASALYDALMALLVLQGVYNVYACITHPNERSERFHKSYGFQKVGVFQKAGYKFGRWCDVIWLEKPLHDRFGAPEPIKPVAMLCRQEVQQILLQAEQRLLKSSIR
ncbi:N-acetyltransferase family protein [Hydrogenoanaerobacterium sp.]|uniref:GNAT family N-acetyltransferase n=1 Tax=Hydrogenoanaerobacterium sp. TaxID=2953763 RepID=UPI00289BC4C5|nr:N-acetyltransferase family protein [Hydrogenoanaerobacterium sp.]